MVWPGVQRSGTVTTVVLWVWPGFLVNGRFIYGHLGHKGVQVLRHKFGHCHIFTGKGVLRTLGDYFRDPYHTQYPQTIFSWTSFSILVDLTFGIDGRKFRQQRGTTIVTNHNGGGSTMFGHVLGDLYGVVANCVQGDSLTTLYFGSFFGLGYNIFYISMGQDTNGRGTIALELVE